MRNSVIATTLLSLLLFLISLFDNVWLPLAFLVWNLLPVLLLIDLVFWAIKKYVINK
jgi:hypothetical protein